MAHTLCMTFLKSEDVLGVRSDKFIAIRGRKKHEPSQQLSSVSGSRRRIDGCKRNRKEKMSLVKFLKLGDT
jgi:hypothetical protein